MSRRDILPAHGTMTPDQLYGFRVACACMQTWGHQLANSTPDMRLYGLFMEAAAKALSTKLGRGQIPPASASLIPEGFRL